MAVGMSADNKIDPKAMARVRPFVYVIAAVSAMSGLLFGYDIGGSGGTYMMEGFREYFHWPPASADSTNTSPELLRKVADQEGWIPAMFTLGCVLGTLPSGYLVDRFGRKGSIMGLTVIFSIGAIIQLFPMNINGLYAGRFICGVGIGSLSMASTLYQSETAPAHVRGFVVAIQQLAITFGILLAGALNVALQHWDEGWRISYGGNVVFSIMLLIMMFFMPESPRWLMSKGREEEATAALHATRFEDEVEPELYMIRQAIEEERALEESEGTWMDLVSNKELMSYRTAVGFFVQFLQQFTGINAVMYFAPLIFSDFLSPSAAIGANLSVAAVNFLGTFIALYLVDRAGRRILFVSGGMGMALFTALFAIFTSSLFDYKANTSVGIALICFVALYVVNFSYSWGPLGWIVPAEIFPQNLRGKGMTITTLANWLSNFLISKMVPIMILKENLDLWGTFTFFSAFCGFMSVVILLFLPETKGVNLEDMEAVFLSFIGKPWYKKMRLSTSPELPGDFIKRPSRVVSDVEMANHECKYEQQ